MVDLWCIWKENCPLVPFSADSLLFSSLRKAKYRQEKANVSVYFPEMQTLNLSPFLCSSSQPIQLSFCGIAPKSRLVWFQWRRITTGCTRCWKRPASTTWLSCLLTLPVGRFLGQNAFSSNAAPWNFTQFIPYPPRPFFKLNVSFGFPSLQATFL